MSKKEKNLLPFFKFCDSIKNNDNNEDHQDIWLTNPFYRRHGVNANRLSRSRRAPDKPVLHKSVMLHNLILHFRAHLGNQQYMQLHFVSSKYHFWSDFMIFGSFEVVLLAYKLAMIVFANSKKRPSVPGLYLIQLPDLCFASKTSISNQESL